MFDGVCDNRMGCWGDIGDGKTLVVDELLLQLKRNLTWLTVAMCFAKSTDRQERYLIGIGFNVILIHFRQCCFIN